MSSAARVLCRLLGAVFVLAAGAACSSAPMPFDARGAGAPSVPPSHPSSDLAAAFPPAFPVRATPRTAVLLLAEADDASAPPSEPGAGTDGGADDGAELAKKLSNPVASLISVPFQMNWDSGSGPDGRGKRRVLNVQPVVPLSLGEDWNLIVRTIVPVIEQHEVFAGAGDQGGIGDVTQSWFFSPKAPTSGGWIWGAGPVLLIPTAGDDLLGAEKWGAGPTALVLKQDSGWTYGALANHVWSFAGDDDRGDVNTTFLQPFLSYTTKSAWTFGLNAEAAYDWEQDELAVPVNVTVSKVLRLGRLPVQFTGGVRYWAERAENGPEGFGFRLAMTLLFPASR